MYFHYTSWIFRKLFPMFIWKKEVTEKIIYLTFDDGPIPEVTEFVLDELKKYEAKATFFCVGDNIGKYPDIFEKLILQGHSIGNHTFNHYNGWKTKKEKYLKNIQKCQQIIDSQAKTKAKTEKKLFRPPYGKIKLSLMCDLKKDYNIVMWHVLSGDFDPSLDKKTCLQKTIQHSTNGSVVVFHDSLKAEQNLRYVLPKYLKHFADLGYRFESL
ncbi:MAG: polysaccharide deacetylase family protein [Bacteroidetes bacterium]|nr:MAG: polysaccharide deacetylase family protein [Bacteroidota bacterium]